MEYLSGGDLQEYILKKEGQKCSEKEAQHIFRQIVNAIYYCHFQNIIHRDLKLQNILIEDQEQLKVKVCDFGIAGMCIQSLNDPTLAGSPKYISPEVLLYNSSANPSMDIWALGVILFRMVYGVYPFEAGTIKELFEKIKKGTFTFPQN